MFTLSGYFDCWGKHVTDVRLNGAGLGDEEVEVDRMRHASAQIESDADLLEQPPCRLHQAWVAVVACGNDRVGHEAGEREKVRIGVRDRELMKALQRHRSSAQVPDRQPPRASLLKFGLPTVSKHAEQVASCVVVLLHQIANDQAFKEEIALIGR